MKAFLFDLLLYAAKTLGSKYIDRLIDWLDGGKLVFTKVSAVACYSHYIGQNHVREGGQMKIFQALVSLSVFNPGKSPRVLRELTLFCAVDGAEHTFQLYDTHQRKWEENYQIPPKQVSGYTWQAAPEGRGLTMQHGADGIIPIINLETINFYLTYRDEHNRPRRIPMDSIKKYRLPKEQIAE